MCRLRRCSQTQPHLLVSLPQLLELPLLLQRKLLRKRRRRSLMMTWVSDYLIDLFDAISIQSYLSHFNISNEFSVDQTDQVTFLERSRQSTPAYFLCLRKLRGICIGRVSEKDFPRRIGKSCIDGWCEMSATRFDGRCSRQDRECPVSPRRAYSICDISVYLRDAPSSPSSPLSLVHYFKGALFIHFQFLDRFDKDIYLD